MCPSGGIGRRTGLKILVKNCCKRLETNIIWINITSYDLSRNLLILNDFPIVDASFRHPKDTRFLTCFICSISNFQFNPLRHVGAMLPHSRNVRKVLERYEMKGEITQNALRSLRNRVTAWCIRGAKAGWESGTHNIQNTTKVRTQQREFWIFKLTG